MRQPKNNTYADRMTAAAEAKKALQAKFRPKPAAKTTEFVDREARRAAELEAVRAARAAERDAKRKALEDAERLAREAEEKAREARDTALRSSQRAELLAMYGKQRRR